MRPLSDLERRLLELRESAAERRAQEQNTIEAQMRLVAPLRDRFERARESWMRDLVVPRLEALGHVLPCGGQVEHQPQGIEATMKCGWNREVGMGASLIVSIAPGPGFERALVHVRPLFVPMLAGNPSESSREFEIIDQAQEALGGFLDDRIVAFAEAYFQAEEASSPYQRECSSTDPVCGMTVHHTPAAAVLEHEGRRYYFCAISCADEFRLDPDRYLRAPRPEKAGGIS